MKNIALKIIIAAGLALTITCAIATAALAAESANYVYAQTFDGLTQLRQGEGGMSSSQLIPSLATVVKDPANNGNKGDVVKMILSVSNPKDSAAAEEEARTGGIGGSPVGTNVDRNLTVANQTLSYKTHAKLVFEVDYFIEENSSGTFESQIIQFTHGDSDAGGAWLNLWRINTANGVVHVLGNSRTPVILPIGEWVTLSLLVDMETGAADFYVNNVYRISDSFGKNKLSFNENQWNIAKINKLSSNGVGNPSGYKGAFYVDNARVHTFTDASDFDTIRRTFDKPVVCLNVVSATGNVSRYEVGADGKGKVLQTPAGKIGSATFDAVTLRPAVLDASVTDGLLAPADAPSIRMVNAGGIRFGTNLNTQKLEKLLEMNEDGLISIGTLISPAKYVKEAGEFSIDALRQLPYEATYLDVQATIGAYYDGSARSLKQGYDQWFTGAITNIQLKNRELDFAAIGYVKIPLADGSVHYLYSYNNQNMTLVDQYAASLAEVANAELEKDGWTEAQKLALRDLASDAVAIPLTSGKIGNVQAKQSQLFFTLTKGTDKTTDDIYCRLTYDGANGWRLQANAVDYNHFRDVGAGQALSIYMSEGFRDTMIPLTVVDENGKLKITAENSVTYAVLNYDTFGIDFYSGEGKPLYNLNSITKSGSDITVAGKMDATEGVYGGGERFDAVNRRGSTMSLFSYDAYDAGGASCEGTYVAIPLFTTSRGGGMFINRYEPMTVSFPKSGKEGKWSVILESALADIYFYATGEMRDVLKAYTDLTGHASLPEEWAQGTLVCRYSPDFHSLGGLSGKADGDIYYEQITDVPGYTGYYVDNKAEVKATADAVLRSGQYLHNSAGQGLYRYVVEGTDDVNGNGITGETYFVRTTPKGAPSGAGIIYIVESMIEAGMKPTGVVLEGLGWAEISTTSAQYDTLKEAVDYLNKQDIKAILYMGIAEIYSNMKGYKPEYQVWASVYENYNTSTNTKGKLIDRTYMIPKAGTTNNPDTVSSGGTQQYLDITNPEAVKWYMDAVWGQLIELGIDGCKIDFCETMPNEGYYKQINVNGKLVDGYIEYDWYDQSVFDKADVHHAYPTYFISLFYRSMLEQKAKKNIDDGFVVLSRGGGIGSQRSPYLWAGDQTRRFMHLKSQLTAAISSGISGVPFMTYDLAGYAYTSQNGFYGNLTVQERDGDLVIPDFDAAQKYESEIFLRALQYSVFGNILQPHGDVRHMYQLTPEAQELSALYIKLHDELAWYLQKTSQHACDTGMPMIRHMILQYQNDGNVIELDDQFMYGDALLVAPVLTYNAKTENGNRVLDYGSDVSRTVYLPAGNWTNLNTGEKIVSTGETVTVTAGLAQIPVFLNTESADAEALQKVFAASTWTNITNYGK